METITPRPVLEWGVATLALGGQSISGDQHLIQLTPSGALVAVVDGLGHGHEAAEAAKLAVATLTAYPDASAIELVRRCHTALAQTRGVVLSLAHFDENEETMMWLGVGNVAGVLLRANGPAGPAKELLLLRAGVVGYQLPPVSAAVLPVMPGDTLIFATDGLSSDFAEGAPQANETPQHLAARLLAQHGKGTDDALVLVAQWMGRPKHA